MRGLVLVLVLLFSSGGAAYSNPDIPVRGELEVWNIMEYELKTIVSQGLDMPELEVVIRDWSRFKGWVAQPNFKPRMYLWDRYDSYDEAHFAIAHEFGHIWLYHTGRDNTEDTAHLFAVCYGSASAQRYGRDARGITGDCEVLEPQN